MNSATPRRPIAVELFSGCGGFGLGVEQAGFDVVAAVDYDPVHLATYERNAPRVATVCADVRDLDSRDLKRLVERALEKREPDGWTGRVDLVFGGPPCQGFSVIGHRQHGDERNRQILEFARVVEALRPRYFALENVPGLLNTAGDDVRHDLLIDDFSAQLREYRLAPPAILNAADFGIPQTRRRVFVFGAAKDQEPLVVPSPRSKHAPPSVREAIADLPSLEGRDELFEQDELRLSASAAARARKKISRYAQDLATSGQALAAPRPTDPQLFTGMKRTRHAVETQERFAATPQGTVESKSRLYRLDWNRVSRTLRAGTGYERGSFSAPRPIHPGSPRVITVREALRLSGFPDWFRCHVTNWYGFRQVGNAVPPPLARAVAEEVVSALGASPSVAPSVDLGPDTLIRLSMEEASEHFGARHATKPCNARRRRTGGRKATPNEIAT